MAIYEYYCSTCRTRFEERRPMSQVATAVKCANGHEAERTVSAFAFGKAGAQGIDFEAASGGGGCCGGGGGCACSN
jgi:putative FmdB family regulatory protein